MLVRFGGRTKGAIGIMYQIETEVKADTLEDAILELYDRFEHISGTRKIEKFTPKKYRKTKLSYVEVFE